VITQRKQLGGGAIANGETDTKNASVDGPLVAAAAAGASIGLSKHAYVPLPLHIY
jgi:hypothetical protein